MRQLVLSAAIFCALAFPGSATPAQEVQTGAQNGPQAQQSYQNMTPEQRAAATRTFLGLGPEPDKAAATRGAPLFQQNCAFCHGPQARGATGPSLITSDQVLGDDHGELLVEALKAGRPAKGMPSFATMSSGQLQDIAEFLHLQVEEVANRGTYHVLNILVGNKSAGETYVAAHCTSCHTAQTFAHLGSKFRSPDQLQRYWIWPARGSENLTALTATVKQPHAAPVTGRVTQISDFRITVIDSADHSHTIERTPAVAVQITNPLTPHEQIVRTLANGDMHNVTAYLDSLK